MDIARAIADYTKAIGLKPDDLRAYVGRAKARLEQLDAVNAKTDLRKAMELDPESRLGRLVLHLRLPVPAFPSWETS